MFASSRRLLLKFSFVVVMVVLALAVQTQPASAQFCTGFNGDAGDDCLVEGCYDQVYCRAIACFQRSWANGGDGSECCFHNFNAQFCGSSCPLFC